jgi:hypothetical protein
MARHLEYCTRRLRETFARLLQYRPRPVGLADAELREVIDACDAAIAPLGAAVAVERWIAYTGIVTAAQSARHLVDRQSLKAMCVLNNLTFACDDLDLASHDLGAILPELRKICASYYNEDDAWHAYEAGRVLVTQDHMLRDSPIKTVLCTTSPEQYFQFRVVDVGIDFWMKMSYPIYRHEPLAEYAKSGLAARLTTRGLTVVNDCYSYDREAALGEVVNCFHLCDLADDASFHDFFEARLNDIAEDIRCIKAFDEITREVLSDLLYGNFLWSTSCHRYAGGVNHVNAPIQRLGDGDPNS